MSKQRILTCRKHSHLEKELSEQPCQMRVPIGYNQLRLGTERQ